MHIRQMEEQPSSMGCEHLYGVPILTDSVGSSFKIGVVEAQKNLIKYLVDCVVKKLEDFAIADDNCGVEQEHLVKIRYAVTMIVVPKIGVHYREWLESHVFGITEVAFKNEFCGAKGPEKIFKDIFPDISIAEFVNECLNGVDASALGLEDKVQEDIRGLIQSCLN
jgi:hypothetical protein